MKSTLLLFVLFLFTLLSFSQEYSTHFIEAESFDNRGGWVLDQQFMDVMGSPYLMAHGLGIPVADARTTIQVPSSGKYYLFVRTMNWAAPWTHAEAPGRFRISLNGETLDLDFGQGGAEWKWNRGGAIELSGGQLDIALHDLTGFNGRCDAIVLTSDPGLVPPDDPEVLKEFRTRSLRIPDKPGDAGDFDFVVVGGGMAGTCAAISAARLGLKVALIQNRPVLGGNNSSEVRVHLGARINQDPWPALGNLVNEIGPARGGNAMPGEYYEDDKKLRAVKAEPNISLFLNYHANKVEAKKGQIRRIIARNTETGLELGFRAPLFADCTGDGSIGYLAGAEYMMGREGRDAFGEPTAPEEADKMTMGASVQWYSDSLPVPVPFPDIQWGIPMDRERAKAVKRGDWDWETGMDKDMIHEFERIRDFGLLVVFSNWAYVKNHSAQKDLFSHEQLQWVAYIAGKRESRRLVGDYVLNEHDLTEPRIHDDGTAPTTWTIDLHYPHPENSSLFPEGAYRSIAKHIPIHPYPIPFRCLYSKNIDNLMMAGRCISVSHVALGTVRLMRTGGMMGEVLGMAATVCTKHDVLPREVYRKHFSELEQLMNKGAGNPDLPGIQNYNLGRTLSTQ